VSKAKKKVRLPKVEGHKPDPLEIVTCPECGNDQGDMGKNVCCEECGFGPMPYYDAHGVLQD
jgi:ribosomal protein L37E